MHKARFIIVGAGIAGAGIAYELAGELAYELAADASVVLLEREAQPGYHTTGRSAAIYSETYGNAAIRALSSASRAFFSSPPADFAAHEILGPCGSLVIGGPRTDDRLDALARTYQQLVSSVRRLTREEALKLVPILKPECIAGAVYEPHSMHMDVDAIHQGYLRGLKLRGGRLITGADVTRIDRTGGVWEIHSSGGTFAADILINAAGAWADVIGALAGAKPLGLQPLRRTAAIVAAPPGLEDVACPFVIDIDEQFYFVGEAGKILVSLADETPSPPCDAYPDDYDVALAIDRIQEVADFPVSRVERSWAGLRNFFADRTPAAGYDSSVAGFFWLAGQGGYGIQTAPALSKIAALLALGQEIADYYSRFGITEAALSPKRFRY